MAAFLIRDQPTLLKLGLLFKPVDSLDPFLAEESVTFSLFQRENDISKASNNSPTLPDPPGQKITTQEARLACPFPGKSTQLLWVRGMCGLCGRWGGGVTRFINR
jgi:hypothetical protein